MSKPIIVMHLRASNFVGGPEKQILEHLQRIDRKLFRPVLCSFTNNGHANDLLRAGESDNICTLKLKSKSAFSPMLIWQLKKLLMENSVQLLVTHGYKPNIIGYFAAKLLGIPMIVYSHGWTGESSKIRFYEHLDRQIMKLAHNIIAVSEGHKRQIVDAGISDDRITVIHNAVSVPKQIKHGELRSRLSLPENATVVVSAGRLSPEKNYSGLIKAATPILKERDSVFFVVYGEGVLRAELERQIVQAGIQHRFILPGFIADVQSMLADADIFVSPSHTEGLPVAVLEAAGAGLPVVATAVGGTPEVVHDGFNGLLVPAEDMKALGDAIAYLLNNSDEAACMGKRGAAMVRESFDFEMHARALEALYIKAIKNDSK